ncbi:hypothetical protein CI109_107247 [Kwoniella shandongensis]|uniref:Uncharacterized protein n=1 Tax=Kwoniella shandongensis TaxID=1734106 RepID=A0A5M6C7K7_9TREE|nr:uncharacterized protein CI109_002530 [Kwoniella shandongensis]KAA5529189.1 hypothetical protein CI109_002530 [Kwoniella shandongensis]
MAPTLTGFVGNSRVRRVRAAAALAGVELNYDDTFTFKSEWKTEEFLKKNPFGFLPILELEDGTTLRETGAIAEYVAELGPNSTLLPSDLTEKAKVHAYQCTADQEIQIPGGIVSGQFSGNIPYNKGVQQALIDKITRRLTVLDTILLNSTFLVGERITLADIFIATAFTNIATTWFDASLRAQIPNVVRLVNTIIYHPKLAHIFTGIEFVEKLPSPPVPVKEKKAEKPKAEAAPKAPKAPKAKEVDEEEEEPLVPEEPKVKNPLDDLPKSAFNLEEWKRQYSNNDTRTGAIPWFYEKFDKDGFSIWKVDFKYNEELTMTFMSSNQIGGFFNRLEASRKYLFGSVGVLGKTNDSIITGVLILRGQEVVPVVDVAPDYESYEYKKLDLENAEDKSFFEAALAWDLVVDGKEWVDGKNFK